MEPSLVVLAAGIGSRYGGTKQLDTFGPGGETIIDFSVFDAIEAGFKKVVFVIRKSIEQDFKEAFLDNFRDKIQVEIVFQELDNLPDGLIPPTDRIKPWGTGHAVMVTEPKVQEPFAIINADDFYGKYSFQLIYDHLKSMDPTQLGACMVGFVLSKTLSKHGTVARGICSLNEDMSLSHITEMTKISRHNDGEIYNAEEGLVPLKDQEVISMNLMGFSPAVFSLIRENFHTFIQANAMDLKSEFYIPEVLDNMVKMGIKVPVLPTEENWIGVTYQEDKSDAIKHIGELVQAGHYPSPLWKH